MKRLILGSMLILTTGLGAAVVKRKLIKDAGRLSPRRWRQLHNESDRRTVQARSVLDAVRLLARLQYPEGCGE
jgi:hypothetical protein